MLSMKDVFDHCGNPPAQSYFEGSAILRDGLLIDCIITEKKDRMVKLLGLCLKGSDVHGHPHEVVVSLEEEVIQNQIDKTYKILNAECSCEAGSNKCKHIAAVLHKLERTPETALEYYTPSELAEQGGATPADRAKNWYTPKRLSEIDFSSCKKYHKHSKVSDDDYYDDDDDDDDDDDYDNDFDHLKKLVTPLTVDECKKFLEKCQVITESTNKDNTLN